MWVQKTRELMDLVGILDSETTGTDPATSTCIEVAFVRFSLKHRCAVDCFSWLIEAASNEAENINHIPASVLLEHAWPAGRVWQSVHALNKSCEAILAHHADFDKQWVPPEYKSILVDTPWIDTCNGVDWPKQSKPGSSLISLVLEHGLGVVDPHRALSDCLMIAALLRRVSETHDIQEILARGLRPTATFQALVSFDDRDKVKTAGFHWKSDTKQWLRTMAVEDVNQLPFPTRRV